MAATTTFELNSFGYDFGSHRVNATLQRFENGNLVYLNMSFPFVPPGDMGSSALQQAIVDRLRLELAAAANFSEKKS